LAIVVITGASSGIGEATARRLARSGHRLVLAARRAERLQALAAELAPLTEVLVVQADVSDPQSLGYLAQQAGERFGSIDVWINNAGIGDDSPWWEGSPETVTRTIATNFTAPILGAHAALKWMLPQRRGHIINIGSVAGHVAVTGVYSATKYGLRGHTHALRRELAPYGIAVSLVSPGFIRTEMTTQVKFPMPPADVVAEVIERLLRRPRREVVVPGWYRPFIAFTKLFPSLIDWGIIRFGSRFRPQTKSR